MAMLSLTSSTYGKTPLGEALRRIKAHGFDALEITAVPGFHIDASSFNDSDARALKAQLLEIGLSVSAITSGPCPLFAGPAELEYLRKTLALAERLGAPIVITYATKTPRTDGMPASEWRGNLCKQLANLADDAARRGLRIAYETPRMGIEIVREVGHRALGYNLCVPHILPAIAPEDSLHAIIDLAADAIINTHLADVRQRVHKHLVPGDGEVDFRALFEHLRRIGYRGSFTWDLYPYAETPDFAAERVQKFMDDMRATGLF